jgi:pimeloyl-ACP methyl ester carboxylesterase
MNLDIVNAFFDHTLHAREMNFMNHYNDHVSNRFLLLIHGWPDTSELWNEYVIALREDFDIITCDLPGFHPEVSTQYASYSYNDIISCISNYVEGLGEKIFIIGHDWGAAIAYKLVDVHPHLFEKMIGIDIGPSLRNADILFNSAALYMPLTVLQFVLRSCVPFFRVCEKEYVCMVNSVMCRFSTPSVTPSIFEKSICDRNRSCSIYFMAFIKNAPDPEIKIPTLVLHSGNGLTNTEFKRDLLEYERVTLSCKHWDFFYDVSTMNVTIDKIMTFFKE